MTNDKQKDRFVELLEEADKKVQEYILENDHMDWIPKPKELSEVRADYLLANGVIVPPCKVGQTVYFIHRLENSITEHEVNNFYVGKKGISINISGVMHPVKPYEFGRIFFSAKEETEAKLEEGVQG